jgi:hypothetical protein
MPGAGGVNDAEPADPDDMGEHRREQHGPILSGKAIGSEKILKADGRLAREGSLGGGLP